jgi:hypothetical protein
MAFQRYAKCAGGQHLFDLGALCLQHVRYIGPAGDGDMRHSSLCVFPVLSTPAAVSPSRVGPLPSWTPSSSIPLPCLIPMSVPTIDTSGNLTMVQSQSQSSVTPSSGASIHFSVNPTTADGRSWIPLRWNFLLILVNTVMVTALYLERQRANRMSPEMEQLFADGKFQKRGFSRVEFMRLYNLAETVTLPHGHVLVKQGQVKGFLYFVLDGKVQVNTKEGEMLAVLDPYHFIGEISLLSRRAQDFDSAASADVIVGGGDGGGTTFLKWDFDTLELYLKGDREVSNALSAYFNYDLTAKLLRDGQIQKASVTSAQQEEAKTTESNKERIKAAAPVKVIPVP